MLHDLRWLTKGTERALVTLLLVQMLGKLPLFLLPLLWGWIVKLLTQGVDESTNLAWISAAWFSFPFLIVVTGIFSAQLGIRVHRHSLAKLHQRLLDRLDTLTAARALRWRSLEMVPLFQRDSNTVVSTIVILPNLLATCLCLLGVGVLLLFLDRPAFLGGLAAGVAAVVIVRALSSRIAFAFRRLHETETRSQSFLTQVLLARDELSLLGSFLSFGGTRHDALQGEYHVAQAKARLREGLRDGLASLVFAAIFAAILVHLVVQTSAGNYSVLVSIAICDLLLGSAFGLAVGLRHGLLPWHEAIVSYRRLRAFSRDPLASCPPVAACSAMDSAPLRVDLESASFAYEPERPLLGGLNLSIAQGEVVAITGQSGMGKTTLLRLVAGQVPAHSGFVRLGGVPLASWNPAQLRHSIAFCHQQSQIFDTTLRENLLIANPDVHDRELLQYLDELGVDIQLDEVLGAGNRQLSGGERQRVGIIRLLLRHEARLWLLDEPTATLDHDVELQALRAIQRHRRGRTTIIVTHSQQALQLAERVILLADGALQELTSLPDVETASTSGQQTVGH